MTSTRGDTGPRQHQDDLQHDGHGKGHAPEKSKEALDKELDKALQDFFPVIRPAGALSAHQNGACGRSQS